MEEGKEEEERNKDQDVVMPGARPTEVRQKDKVEEVVAPVVGLGETTPVLETPLPEVESNSLSSGYEDIRNPGEWTMKKHRRRGWDKGKSPWTEGPAESRSEGKDRLRARTCTERDGHRKPILRASSYHVFY